MRGTFDAIRGGTTLRGRVLRILLIFTIVQLIVAALVSARSKAAARRRELLRPRTYPSIEFPTIDAEGDVDDLQLYMRADRLSDDIVAAIDAAEHYVYAETYIWIDDASGMRIVEALARAVERGVKCVVIFDWLQSSKNMEQRLRSVGVTCFAFRPITGRDALRPSNLLRDHRKVLVADGTTGFLGGYNFGDEFLAWRDTHVRITGKTVRELENAFVDFWNQQRPLHLGPLPRAEKRSWDPGAFVHRNDPSLAIFPIRGIYIEAIDRASKQIWITNAYFVPDRAIR
ncbi:MAG: phospholipase D-like domain-containing protein, partial [Gaiellales bacterium]